MVVDTGLVGGEIGVDGEGSLDGAVSHDLGLDLGDLGGDGVDGVGDPAVSGVVAGVSGGAGGLALGGRLRGTAGTVLAVGVVVALLEAVGHAPLVSVVEPSSDDTGAVPVVEGAGRVAAVASLSAGHTAAGQQVLSGDSGLEFLAAGDADTVADGLDGSEGPAGATGALVADLLDGLAVGPRLGGEELIGDVLEGLDFLEGELEVLGGLKGAHEVLDLFEVHSVEVAVVAGLPDLLVGVDVVDDGLEVQEGALLLGNGRDGEHTQQKHCEGLHQRDQLSILQPPCEYKAFPNTPSTQGVIFAHSHYLFMRGIKLHPYHKPKTKMALLAQRPIHLPSTLEEQLANPTSCRSRSVKLPANLPEALPREGSQAESIKAAIHKLRTESPQFSELGFMQARSRSYFFERSPKPKKLKEPSFEMLINVRIPQRKEQKGYLPELVGSSPKPSGILSLPNAESLHEDCNVILLKRNMRYRLQKLPIFERSLSPPEPQPNLSVTGWNRNPEEAQDFPRHL